MMIRLSPQLTLLIFVVGPVIALVVSGMSRAFRRYSTRIQNSMGDVTRVEHAYYFVKEKDGREVRLHADKTTLMLGQLKQGDRVEAEVTEQNHALRMRSLP